MTIKVISRKIRQPELPYLHVPRENLNQSLESAFEQNKKCLYLTGITGYGKTTAIKSYLEDKPEASKLWYILDEWDKDPVTFLSYLYQIFFKQEMLSDDIEELLSQSLNNEKQIKNFIGLLSNELDENLKNDTFLVIDNFQEVQNEEVIQQIIIFLLNYCPEKLKLILISQEPIPEIFYPFFLKHEIEVINPKELFLSEREANEILNKIGKTDSNLFNDLFNISHKNISLFILMAQKFNDKESLDKYHENKMLKTSLNLIISQIYKSLNNELKDFINQILFLEKIKVGTIDKNLVHSLKALSEDEILIFNKNEDEYNFNPVFVPFLTENFFNLDDLEKDKILDKVIESLSNTDAQILISTLFKAKAYSRIMVILKDNYQYYFRNYLYNTLEHLIDILKEHFPDDELLIYLQIRIYRLTGKLSESMKILESLPEKHKTSEIIILEEGICLSSCGYYQSGINFLSALEKNNNLNLINYLSLINGLGICYMNVHQLDLAKEYFLKAIELKSKLVFQHDLIKIYHNLGLTYTWVGDFTSAVSVYEESLNLAQQLKTLPFSATYNNLAIIHNFQGQYDKAYQYCVTGLEIVDKINNEVDRIQFFLTLTECYRGLKNAFKIEECVNYLDSLPQKSLNPIFTALLFKLKALIALDNSEPDKARDYIFNAIKARNLKEGDSAIIEFKLELAIVDYYAENYLGSLSNLDDIEESIKQGKHLFHLARVYIYKALNYSALNQMQNFDKYKVMAYQLIKENNYPLLAEKLNIENTNEVELITVPTLNMENPLKIFSFGEMVISRNDITIAKKGWLGKNTKLLLAYFLLNKKGSTKEQIFDTFFPDGDKSRSAFHMLIKRLRDVFSTLFEDTEIIQFNNNMYSFNFSIDYWWDAAQFEFLLNESKKIDNPVEKYQKVAGALSIYKGHFMAGMELESWVFSTQEYYRNLAYKNFNELSNYYLSQKRFDDLLKLSGQFQEIDLCLEDACKFRMQAFMGLKRKNDALQQFVIFEKNMKKILDDKPSVEMQRFRDKLSQMNEYEELEVPESNDLLSKNVELQNEIKEREKAMEELKNIQSHLIHSEKMSGLSTLVAGVAHEINNPTNFVNGIAHNLLSDINDLKQFIFELAGDEADSQFIEMFTNRFQRIESHLGDISQGSERIKTVVQDLRSFSRLDEAEQKRVDIIESITTTLRFVQSQYNKNVEFITDFQEKRIIECYPAQLNQAFMNIIINACQAIQAKQLKTGSEALGKLVIKTFLQKGNSLPEKRKDDFLGIEFRDDGIGMPEDIKGKIFDPFFTTKDVGSGKGMGLSVTYSIIEKHEGIITVDSELGIGTTITLYIPCK